jgi:type III secretion protein V
MLARLNRLAVMASQRTDVVIALFMMLAIVMMIIPLPTFLVDILIGINIAFSLLVLVVAFYIAHSVDFSALPPVILLSTLFRLALSITTTRLILLNGEAGEIVEAFGNFVIAGEVVIGLVVFLIITVAQFIVITKGAERVAEVAARFTLDAMPGKQMSIDNDLRNGDIDQPEARRRRSRLERESQLYGAMDGAMKFVKGDAIAGLVILCVNLLGGLLIGMLKRGMPFGEAVHTYSLLSVGDGLIAQIPALLISVAAGTVVTRVTTDAQTDLGTEIINQLGANQRALALTSFILLGVAFIPGFPAPVFIAISMVLGGAAYALHRRTVKAEPVARDVVEPEVSETQALPVEETEDTGHFRVTVWISQTQAAQISLNTLKQKLEGVRYDVSDDLGVEIPRIGLRIEHAVEPERFHIDLEGVPVMEGNIRPDAVLLQDDVVHLDLLAIEHTTTAPLLRRKPAVWVNAEQAEVLADAGVGHLDLIGALEACVRQTLRGYAGEFLGIQEARQMLTEMEEQYPELVKETLRVLPLQRIADILRRLVGEHVSIRNRRVILEAIVEWAPRDLDTPVLAEHVRAALARQICYEYADSHRVISAYVFSRQLEEALRAPLRRSDKARPTVLPPELTRTIALQLQQAYDAASHDLNPVVMVSADIRRPLRQLLMRQDLDVPVLSYQDLTREFTVQSLSTLTLPDVDEMPAEATTEALMAP